LGTCGRRRAGTYSIPFFFGGQDLFHDFGRAIGADFAGRIINSTLGQRELATAGAFFRIEFFQSRGALF
jgi:hypothetical protein